MSDADKPILALQDVMTGMAPALAKVSVDVQAGEIVALLGANGSGKTSVLRAVLGLETLIAGRIDFRGAPLDGIAVEHRARLGIAYVPEGRRVFPGLTVYDNLVVGCDADPAERRRRLEDVVELFRPLKERLHVPAWQMSGGQQQMVALGRALMTDPLLMMLDEPSLGLAPTVVRDLLAHLRTIAARGTAILLAEQNAAAALGVADRAYVLDHGAVATSGMAADFLIDPGAFSAALGLEAAVR
jgi:branched-chain amino acid transport system ATP-binding protein